VGDSVEGFVIPSQNRFVFCPSKRVLPFCWEGAEHINYRPKHYIRIIEDRGKEPDGALNLED